MIALKCAACRCEDVRGPVERAGTVRGVWMATGAWWITCTACGADTLAHETAALFDDGTAPAPTAPAVAASLFDGFDPA